MAVAILERKSNTEENVKPAYMQEKEHNDSIGRKYAMLINPNARVDDVLGRASAVKTEENVVTEHKAPVATNTEPVINSMEALRASILQKKPYLVENARADADIFRADSPINRREAVKPQIIAEQAAEEDENEDLRPTRTTIQYKTTETDSENEIGKIENTTRSKRFNLAKRDIIIISAVVSIIVALFTLIILNSAIISRINNDIQDLENAVKTTKKVYSQVEDEINEYMENVELKVEEYALNNGMKK